MPFCRQEPLWAEACSSVPFELSITRPLLRLRGDKHQRQGSQKCSVPQQQVTPLPPCPAQPTRRVGQKGSTKKCCFWFTDVITPTVFWPQLISLDTCWQEAIGHFACWNDRVTETGGLGSQPVWHSPPFAFVQSFLKDGLFGFWSCSWEETPSAFSRTWFELGPLLWVGFAVQGGPRRVAMHQSLPSPILTSSPCSTAPPELSKMTAVKRRWREDSCTCLPVSPSQVHLLSVLCSHSQINTLLPL